MVLPLSPLEFLANQVLNWEPALQHLCEPLNGKSVGVECTDLPFSLFLNFAESGIQLAHEHEGEVDLHLKGTSLALLRMVKREDPNQSLFDQDVRIEGNLALAQALNKQMQTFQLDWEEWIARITGDRLARPIANIIRNIMTWAEETVKALGENTAEFIKTEQKLSPDPVEYQVWSKSVNTLKDDVDRLSARVDKLLKGK